MRYLVDTNVILNDWTNVLKIREWADQEFTILLTETILQELDKFKKGFDAENYNAREFIRFLSESEVISVNSYGMTVYNKQHNVTIEILKLSDSAQACGLNSDDKIIKTVCAKYTPSQVEFISNDILFRTKVILEGYKAHQLSTDLILSENVSNGKQQTILEIMYPDCFINKEYIKLDELESLLNQKIPHNISVLKITENSGNLFVLIREDPSTFRALDLKRNLRILGLTPRNLEQRILWEQLLNLHNDIFIIEGIAGTSKTLSALLASLELIRLKKFDKLTYIRKTIISGDDNDELGFLPGSLNSKLAGYLHPLKDNLELIVKSKTKKKKEQLTKEFIESEIKALENDFNINYEYIGHLRGRNLSGIIIIDEAQNLTIQNLVLVLSRITSDSKVFVLGSTKQIDNPYLSQANNALTFLMSQCGTFDSIQIQGLTVTKVERGPITQWIELATSLRT